MLITKYITEFFEPKYLEYEVKQSVDIIANKLENIFSNELLHSDIKGLSGQITDEKFIMGIIPGEDGATFNTSLKGRIITNNTKNSVLQIYIVRGSSTYLTFSLSIIASMIYLIMYFNDNKNLTPIYYSLGSLILGCSFSIWLSNNSVLTIQKQFEIFIEKFDLK